MKRRNRRSSRDYNCRIWFLPLIHRGNQEKVKFTVHFWVLHETSGDSMVPSPGSQGSGSASQVAPILLSYG
jgi:hypothetical protein